MELASLARRGALLLVIVAIVAGCTTPSESAPEDLNEDGDRDGIVDGNSPDPWATNESGNATWNGYGNETNATAGENTTIG